MDTRNFDRENVLTILIPKEATTPLLSLPFETFFGCVLPDSRNKRMPTFREYARSSKNKAWREARSRSLWRQEKKEEREREREKERRIISGSRAVFPLHPASPRVRAYAASRTRVNERRRNSAETSNLDLSIHAFLET